MIALREVIPIKPGLKKSLNQTAIAGPGYATFVNGMTVIHAPIAMPTLRDVDMTGISDFGVVRLAADFFAALDAILLEGTESLLVFVLVLMRIMVRRVEGKLIYSRAEVGTTYRFSKMSRTR